MWAGFALALVIAGAPPDIKNPALAEGIDLYEASDFAGALQALTRALDKPGNKRDTARIHLYIGLIQQRFKLKDDAEASFTKALSVDRSLKLPKGTSKAARSAFNGVQEKLGLDEKKKRVRPKPEEGAEARVEHAPKGQEAIAASTATASAGRVELPVAEQGAAPDAHPALSQSGPPAMPTTRVISAVSTESDSSGPVAGWVTLGVGAAAMATGITLGVLSQQNGSDAQSEPFASRQEELYRTAVQQRTLALVAFGVSGAALAVSAILFLTDD